MLNEMNYSIITESATDDVNEIIASLTTEERYQLGMPRNRKVWITKDEESKVSSMLIKRFIIYDEKHPASMLEIYHQNQDRIGDISFATARDYRGKGYASKNIKRMIQWFNSDKNKYVDELLWSAHKANAASQKLATANGFKEIPNTYYGDAMNPDYKYYIYK